jgi:polysaccharide biosynthesis transport protein
MAQYEVTIKDYLRILRRRKGIVALTAGALGSISFIVSLIWQPVPVFTATAKVQINSQQTLNSLYLDAITYNASDEIETQQAVISSYPVLRRAGQELGFFPVGGSSEDSTRVVLALQARIITRPEGYTNIVSVDATGSTASHARQLANTLALVYQKYDDQMRSQQAVRHRDFVERQREKARSELNEAEEAVRSYREDQDLISLDAQASVTLGQISTTDDHIQSLGQDMAAIKAMARDMEHGDVSEQILQGTSRERVGDTFINLGQQLNRERLERDAMLVQYTDLHPSVQRLQVRIEQLQNEMLAELEQRQQVLSSDIGAKRQRLSELRREYNLLPARGLELSRLEREVALRQQVVSVLEEQYQTAIIREADKPERVTVLQWAITPDAPTNSNQPLQRAILGFALGLILGIVLAVLAETMDTSIGTIEDVQEYTETKVVGIIPFINVDEVRASLRRRGSVAVDEAALRRKAQLVAYFDPLSVLAETYRTLRTNIEFVSVEKGAKTLIVTSSMLREGKSTTIANLAMTMAQLGKRTLLVDCDLRKPAVARLFGLDKEPGVTEVIVGNHRWDEVVRTVTDIVTGGMGMEDILQTQGISNLHIITSGAIPPNPAELLNSHRMDEFIAEVRAAYDVVLFDSPPVLHVTDAAILGKKVDGAIVVYKAGDIARTSLKQATNLLKSVEVDLLGIVVNGINADISSEFHDLGYAAYYAYGNDNKGLQRSRKERLVDQGRTLMRRVRGEEPEAWASTGGVTEEPWERDETLPNKIVATLLLAAVGLGLFWQSGLLQRPLGLMPLFGTPTFLAAPEPALVEPDAGARSAAPLGGQEGDAAATQSQMMVQDDALPTPVIDRPATQSQAEMETGLQAGWEGDTLATSVADLTLGKEEAGQPAMASAEVALGPEESVRTAQEDLIKADMGTDGNESQSAVESDLSSKESNVSGGMARQVSNTKPDRMPDDSDAGFSVKEPAVGMVVDGPSETEAIVASRLSPEEGDLLDVDSSADSSRSLADSSLVDPSLAGISLAEKSLAKNRLNNKIPETQAVAPPPAATNTGIGVQPKIENVSSGMAEGEVRRPYPYALRIASYAEGSTWSLKVLAKLRLSGLQAFLQPVKVEGQEMVRLYYGSFYDWDSAFEDGRRRQDEGLIEEFMIVRLPYTITVDVAVSSPAVIDTAKTELPLSDPLLYEQGGQVRRLAAGAFAEFAAAERFLAERPLPGGRVVMR